MAISAGTIVPFGSGTLPSGFLTCDGAAVSRTTYANLFSVIGVTYGAGDGSTTFNLPDLRGRLVAQPTTLVTYAIATATVGIDALTGDVTASGSGSVAATIGAGRVTAAMLASTTGSGAVVLDHSPTLITPTLNSPTLITPTLGAAVATSVTTPTMAGAFGAGAAPDPNSGYYAAQAFTGITSAIAGFFSNPSNTLTADTNIHVHGFRATPNLNQAGFTQTSTAGLVGVYSSPFATGASGTITGVTGYTASPINAGAGTIANAYGYFAFSAGNSGGGAITNQVGFYCDNLNNATNHYGFQGSVTAGANRWNLYMDGAADNYLAGGLLIGTTTKDGANKLQVAGSASLQGGLTLKVRVITTGSSASVSATDNVMVVNKSASSATTINLPSTPAAGRMVVVKDGKGDAASANITITPASGTIDGAASKTLTTAYQSMQLIYNGTQWNVV